MKLKIRHSTIYSYDAPGGQLVQRFHLTPVSGSTQTVIDWHVEAPGMDKALSYTDAFGNDGAPGHDKPRREPMLK
jgi:transglutaminase-like putative cysteine protease